MGLPLFEVPMPRAFHDAMLKKAATEIANAYQARRDWYAIVPGDDYMGLWILGRDVSIPGVGNLICKLIDCYLQQVPPEVREDMYKVIHTSAIETMRLCKEAGR